MRRELMNYLPLVKYFNSSHILWENLFQTMPLFPFFFQRYVGFKFPCSLIFSAVVLPWEIHEWDLSFLQTTFPFFMVNCINLNI